MFIPSDKYAFSMYLISPKISNGRGTEQLKKMKSSCWLSLSETKKISTETSGGGLSNLFAYLYKQQFSIFLLPSSKRKLTRVRRCYLNRSTMKIFITISCRLSLRSRDVIFRSPRYFLKALEKSMKFIFLATSLEIYLFCTFIYFPFLPFFHLSLHSEWA